MFMKSYILKEINQESYIELENKILEWVQTVYLDSPWGTVIYWTLIKNLMYRHNIKLVLLYKALSSWFYIFHSYKWVKYMTEGCYWMIHFPHLDVSIKQDWKEADEHDTCRINSMKQAARFDTLFMSKKERKRFDDWKDIWFDFDRMKEIFPNVEILS